MIDNPATPPASAMVSHVQDSVETWKPCRRTITWSVMPGDERVAPSVKFALRKFSRFVSYRFVRNTTDNWVSNIVVQVHNTGRYAGTTHTSVRHKTDTIYDALIFITPEVYSFSKSDRRSLMMHELGHAFGLQHTQGDNDVMNPRIWAKASWSWSDKQQLRAISKACR